MEYSGLTAISSAIYGDLVKQIGDLAEGLGAGNLGQLMDQDDADGPPQRQGNARPKPGAGAPAQRPGAEPALPENPATDLLRSMLGDQAKMLDSIFEVSISHEVSHEWWAIGVGSDSQKSPFCDESLANFSAMLYYEDRYGPETAAKMIDTNLRMPYSMSRMLGCADAPANLPTSGYKNQLQYGAVIYGKAAMYHDAMRRLIGDDAFFAALRAYYGAYVGRIAGPRSLLELEKTEAPSKAIQAEALYEHWIEQTHGDEDLGGGGAGLADLISPLLGMLGGALGE